MQPLTSDDPAEIGGYRLQARLGVGGMGRVYLASTRAGRPVALKVVRSELSGDPNFVARFRQEIQAAQRVHGLYTAQLVDADPAATPPWLVTSYVPGPSLEEVIGGSGPMAEAMVFRLIAGVAEALQAIHAAGVVHRDLKPSNVLLAEDGPRVIDFGIARALTEAALTRNDIKLGSPDFMAPEQILDLPITPAIDVFALGSLATYAAIGRPPFGRGHVTEVAHRVVHEPPDLAGCPGRLLTLIGACLEKQASARPAPGQILEFCVARSTDLADSAQRFPAWRRADAAPERGAWPSQSPHSATAVLPDFAQSAMAQSWSAAGQAKRRRRWAVAALGTAVLAPVIIATAVVTHLAGGVSPSASAHSAPPASPSSPAVATPAQSPTGGPAPVGPVVLLSQGHPATASSVQQDPWVPSNAVDGNLGTRWSSDYSDPQWLEVDLGATHTLRRVTLDWERAYATAFQIQVSDDGTTWTDIYSTTTGTGGDQTIPVSGTGRYVRMYGTTRATQYGYSLYEFQVYGP
jgi:eukaryotic-like serine/threonine-protein kinase